MGMEMMGNLNQQAKMAKMQQAWDMKKSGTLPIMGKTGTSIFKTLAPEKKKTSDAEVKKRISKRFCVNMHRSFTERFWHWKKSGRLTRSV